MNPIQRSFGRGEISPALAARADLDLYKAALSTQLNFITPKSGGVQNRAGTEFVGDTIDGSGYSVKQIPFVFSDTDAYVLVFGFRSMRVIRNGAFVTETALPIASITLASPAVVTLTAHGYTTLDEIFISTTALTGMPQIGNLTFIVTVVSADTFTIKYKSTGNLVDSTAFSAYVSGGTAARLYTVVTPYDNGVFVDEVGDIDYAQYKDAMILTHPSHPPQKLIRSGHASWTLGELQIGTHDHVVTMAGAKGSAGSNQTRYKVTYIDPGTGKESKPGTEAKKNITGVTKANPCVVTSTGHGYATGDTVLIHNVGGMTELNNREFVISVPSAFTPDAPKTIASITQANPMVVTSTAHGYSNGDKIAFTVTGMVELNDITYGTVNAAAANTFQVYYFGTTTQINSTAFNAFVAGTVLRISPNPTATSTFTLVGVDSTLYGAFSATGNDGCGRTCLTLSSAGDATVAAPNVLTWAGITQNGSWASITTQGALNYIIYKEVGGVFGKIGVSTTLGFSDIGYDEDITDTPIEYTEMFLTASSYPAHVAFHQQRLIFANSNNEPQTLWCSRIGDYYNFCKRTSILDDDPVTFTIVGNNIDPVRNLVPMRVLLCMSQSSEVVAEGTTGESFVPGGVSVHQDSHNGSGTIKPVVVNNTVIYTQKNMRTLMDLFYSFQSNSYDGADIGALASHLFRDGTIVDMAYQKAPNSILWLVRSDGTLVACTYIKDQSILAFSRHETLGTVSGVCGIPEGDETALYLAVKRAGSQIHIERMATRTIQDPTDIKDMIFVDCAISYDGRYRTGDPLAEVLSGTTYAAGELMRLHISGLGHYLTSANVGDAVVLYSDVDDTPVTCTIMSVTGFRDAVVQPDKDVPADMQASFVTNWDLAIKNLGALWHLEGLDLSITGDGWVVANPNNDDYDVITVSSGRVTLPEPHAVIHAGLPYVSDLVTCDIDRPQGTTIMHRGKLVNSVTLYVNDTREFWAGETLPDDDSKEGLKPSRNHVTGETTDTPPALFSEPMIVNIKGRWNEGGRVAVRNIDPLPCEIIAISPDFHVGS
jgi:hypothetical protein